MMAQGQVVLKMNLALASCGGQDADRRRRSGWTKRFAQLGFTSVHDESRFLSDTHLAMLDPVRGAAE